jgi:hypothetical protein
LRISSCVIFLAGLSDYGQVGVGVFPQREEVLIRLARPAVSPLRRRRAPVRHATAHASEKDIDAAIVDDLLELGRRLVAATQLEIAVTARK